MVAEERAQAATLARQSALACNAQSAGWSIDADGDAAAAGDLTDSGGPVLALQWTKVRCGAKGKKIDRPEGGRNVSPAVVQVHAVSRDSCQWSESLGELSRQLKSLSASNGA